MKSPFAPRQNYEQSRKRVGYTPRPQTEAAAYAKLGFKCGLEVHQQLKTAKKLFCHCPAGRYHEHDDFDAEIVRHMRPTLSELGEYDGTALMEFKTRKVVVYRIKNETTCTYEIDDTPPFLLNPEAVEIAMGIALLLKTNIVGEFHITRKQYLDGSIPTGFQRTGILGIEGEIPLSRKTVRIIQLSIEEDSCREISDIGHTRIYSTDRLGMPLIETVTYPDMKTPDEAAEAAQYIRFLARSTGKVRTGIGAAREDVNVSINGGTRVEIKGVAHIARIPELVHNEAFRQKALLEIKQELAKRSVDSGQWAPVHKTVDPDALPVDLSRLKESLEKKMRLLAVNLPGFRGILSFFTQPGKMFADEISERLKVIACLEQPNLLHSEALAPAGNEETFACIRKLLKGGEADAQLLFWAADDDVKTALETIAERCKLAFLGVPNETRKGFADGTTIFERVLPGPDRMYPDTDSAPIPVEEELIVRARAGIPVDVHARFAQFRQWRVPEDTFAFLLKHNLAPLLEKLQAGLGVAPRFAATVLGHDLKHLLGRQPHSRGSSGPLYQGLSGPAAGFSFERLYDLFAFLKQDKLELEIIKLLLPVVLEHPNMDFQSLLTTVNFKKLSRKEVLAPLPILKEKFKKIRTSKDPGAEARWIAGNLRRPALGNMPLRELAALLGEGGDR
ncbi:MAG: Glu-tRNA(Gln) amidotransferase subunit GatE [Candidatus Aminicenantes bacterium]|nr:Glu-tRNA(Gln) amidotransferase subunit GatE [Candidatus Aminicenantes bacterium]